MGEAETMKNRMHIFTTTRPMKKKLIEWGAIELNPLMWLTIWRSYIENYIEKNIRQEYLKGDDQPKSSRNYLHLPSDCYSPKRIIIHSKIRKLENDSIGKTITNIAE